ncbi:MAG: ATP-binding protein [Clostridia bacterium]|nr:ATP-binding protein [Clostridia bacterium]
MEEITVQAKVENLPEVMAFIDRQLEAHDCGMKTQSLIDTAVDDLFTNISMYAYENGTGDATVRFDFDEATRTASITFADAGVVFDPLTPPDPDVNLPPRARKIGGLGLFIVRKTMDTVFYRRESGQNILTV